MRSSNPTQWTETPSARSGCSRPHPAWPFGEALLSLSSADGRGGLDHEHICPACCWWWSHPSEVQAAQLGMAHWALLGSCQDAPSPRAPGSVGWRLASSFPGLIVLKHWESCRAVSFILGVVELCIWCSLQTGTHPHTCHSWECSATRQNVRRQPRGIKCLHLLKSSVVLLLQFVQRFIRQWWMQEYLLLSSALLLSCWEFFSCFQFRNQIVSLLLN